MSISCATLFYWHSCTLTLLFIHLTCRPCMVLFFIVHQTCFKDGSAHAQMHMFLCDTHVLCTWAIREHILPMRMFPVRCTRPARVFFVHIFRQCIRMLRTRARSINLMFILSGVVVWLLSFSVEAVRRDAIPLA